MKIKSKERNELVMKLNGIDSKLKFNPQWNQAVKTVFNSTGSFCFENLVYSDFDSAHLLYSKFKN